MRGKEEEEEMEGRGVREGDGGKEREGRRWGSGREGERGKGMERVGVKERERRKWLVAANIANLCRQPDLEEDHSMWLYCRNFQAVEAP